MWIGRLTENLTHMAIDMIWRLILIVRDRHWLRRDHLIWIELRTHLMLGIVVVNRRRVVHDWLILKRIHVAISGMTSVRTLPMLALIMNYSVPIADAVFLLEKAFSLVSGSVFLGL